MYAGCAGGNAELWTCCGGFEDMAYTSSEFAEVAYLRASSLLIIWEMPARRAAGATANNDLERRQRVKARKGWDE